MGNTHSKLDAIEDIRQRIASSVKAGKEPEAFDLVQALALIVRQHEEFRPGEEKALVPVELLRAIATKLIGKRRWTREKNKQRAAAAATESERILELAQQLRNRFPSYSASQIAQKLVEGDSPPTKVVGGKSEVQSVRNVRRIIGKLWPSRTKRPTKVGHRER
jgi:hypothetical protein